MKTDWWFLFSVVICCASALGNAIVPAVAEVILREIRRQMP
jgi:hypothetical protein